MLDRFIAYEAEGSADNAAPSLASVRHPNTRLVSPLWHGEGCVGLSGLYAALNGIRLALAHKQLLTAADNDWLVRAGLRVFDGRLSPQQCVANGLRVQLWRQLVEAMCEAARQRTGICLVAERLYPDGKCAHEAFDALDNALRRRRVALMMCRGGHYTAVSGVTALSLLLFDSGGAWWISKRVCGVPGDGDEMRHTIYPTSFMALSV